MSAEEMEASAKLKQTILATPVLALPCIECFMKLYSDDCDKYTGCVLKQKQPNWAKKQINYWSRTLDKAEQDFDSTHHECLAVVWDIPLLDGFIKWQTFSVRTENNALK